MPPAVSIIIPCYNEARTISGLLRAISQQSHPIEEMEVIIADGGSTDGTRSAISEFASSRPGLKIHLVENPTRAIPAALNRAIIAAQADIIVRLDAHSIPRHDYVERCLETLERTGAANVGGVWEIQAGRDSWIGQSIAAAAAHPLGAGDARYRVSGVEGPADTVPFGAYRREWLERVGQFNEDLHTNEDYEYNVRIREKGGEVWFNPAIQSIYLARGSLQSLARQYARYGFWKARMLLRHPHSLRWRQALPPLFVLSSLALLISIPLVPYATAALAVKWGAYAAVLLSAALVEGVRRRSASMLGGFPLATATMHLAWGGAFWWGLLTGLLR